MLDDTLRRDFVAQVAQERARASQQRGREYDRNDGELQRRRIETSRWLGLQVRSLLALVVVAEEGSFMAAARRLGYSRSTISHQIAQLETSVGASLVVRGAGSRSVELTPAGSIVVKHGRAVLRLLENAEAQVAELDRGDRRRLASLQLRLGLDPTVAAPGAR